MDKQGNIWVEDLCYGRPGIFTKTGFRPFDQWQKAITWEPAVDRLEPGRRYRLEGTFNPGCTYVLKEHRDGVFVADDGSPMVYCDARGVLDSGSGRFVLAEPARLLDDRLARPYFDPVNDLDHFRRVFAKRGTR